MIYRNRIIVTLLLFTISLSNNIFGQTKFLLINHPQKGIVYNYTVKGNILKPKTINTQYSNKFVQYIFSKALAPKHKRLTYSVNEKLGIVQYIDSSTNTPDSLSFGVYRIKIDSIIGTNITNSIQTYGIPFYEHPYTVYVTRLNQNEVLMIGIITAKENISKQKNQLLEEAVVYIKKAMIKIK